MYNQPNLLYEWYKCACTLLLCVLASYMWLHHKILSQDLQKKVRTLEEHHEATMDHIDSYEKDEAVKYEMVRSILISIQHDIEFLRKKSDVVQGHQLQYQAEQKEILQHILDVYHSVKKWIDNEKQRHSVWYDKENDTYVVSKEIEHNVYVHEAFSFLPRHLGGVGYIGRFTSKTRYSDELKQVIRDLAMPGYTRGLSESTGGIQPFLNHLRHQDSLTLNETKPIDWEHLAALDRA